MKLNLLLALNINSIIEYHNPEGNAEVLRILLSLPQEQALGVINIFEQDTWPFFLDISDPKVRNAVQPVGYDPYKELVMLKDSDITPGRLRNRDNGWKIVQPILFSANSFTRKEWFFPRERMRLLQARAAELEQANSETHHSDTPSKKNSNIFVKVRTIAKYALQVLKRGLHQNSLLNNYHQSGKAKKKDKEDYEDDEGKDDLREENEETAGKRRGRKPSDQRFYEDGTFGIVLTKKIKRYFKKAIDAGIKRKESLREIYVDILDNHFSTGDDEKGHRIHLPKEFCPTRRQLYYFYEKLRKKNPTQYAKLRKGKRYFNLNLRPLTGDSMFFVDGPGAVYQVDSTPLPFAIVSVLNRSWLLGTLYLYTVMDCFSEVIVGWSLGYKQSWDSARAALLCAFTSKRPILEKYGLLDLLDAFPGEGIGRRLVTDKGSEWRGYNANTITDLRMEVANPTAYRPDLKGGIESMLWSIQHALRNMPGSLFYVQERGDKEARLTAAFNKLEFERKLICEMAHHNRTKWIQDYPLRRDMLAKQVLPVPVELWHYGINNMTGALPTYPADYLSQVLLPRTTASADRVGILYRRQHYFSQSLFDEQMAVRVALEGRKKVEISVEPDVVSHVYLHLPTGEMEKCDRIGVDSNYRDVSWYDLNAADSYYTYQKRQNEAKRDQERSKMKSRLKPEQAKAVAEAKQAREGMSNRAFTSNVGNNTAREQQHEHNQRLPPTEKKTNTGGTTPNTGYIGIPDYQDVIDKVNQHNNQEN